MLLLYGKMIRKIVKIVTSFIIGCLINLSKNVQSRIVWALHTNKVIGKPEKTLIVLNFIFNKAMHEMN